LPIPVLNDTFALYQLEYDYFGLSHSQIDYILMTAADVQKCNAGSITICPADRALYDTRSITCESKLYFQMTSKDGPCKRSLKVHYRKPTLLRHGEVWVFHFPSQRQVTIRCPRDNVWMTRTRTLAGAGLIHNATRCSIASGEIWTLPELHGVAHANLVAPSVYVPDVDMLVHIQEATPQQETPSHWHLIITAVSCALTVLLALGMFLQSKFQCAVSCCRPTDKAAEDDTPRSPTHPIPASGSPTATAYAEPRSDSLTFAAYALPRKD